MQKSHRNYAAETAKTCIASIHEQETEAWQSEKKSGLTTRGRLESSNGQGEGIRTETRKLPMKKLRDSQTREDLTSGSKKRWL